MFLAVSCNRQKRSVAGSAVKLDLDAVLGTDEALRLCDVDIVGCSAYGYLNIKSLVRLSEDRLDSQSLARKLNTEALEE